MRGKKFSGSLRKRGSGPGSGNTDGGPSWSRQETRDRANVGMTAASRSRTRPRDWSRNPGARGRGTGPLGRNPAIKWRLEPGDLSRLAAIQAEMLRNALGVLAPGGRLVYATCSLEPEEDEQVVENVLTEKPAARLLCRDELTR